MIKNKPVATTATIRGLIKKSGIKYVANASAFNTPELYEGVTVWQLCDSVCFKVVGKQETRTATLVKFADALAEAGLTFVSTNTEHTIVKAVA